VFTSVRTHAMMSSDTFSCWKHCYTKPECEIVFFQIWVGME